MSSKRNMLWIGAALFVMLLLAIATCGGKSLLYLLNVLFGGDTV